MPWRQSRHFALSLALCLAFVCGPAPARAGERKVLVARPAVAKGLSPQAIESIKNGMYRGLTSSTAYAVNEGDISGEMKKLGVASLSRKLSTTVVDSAVAASIINALLTNRFSI